MKTTREIKAIRDPLDRAREFMRSHHTDGDEAPRVDYNLPAAVRAVIEHLEAERARPPLSKSA